MTDSNDELFITERILNAEWDDFVLRHEHGNIFQTRQIFDLYQSLPTYSPGALFLCHKTQGLKGVLVYAIIREKGLAAFFSTRAIITGGPLIHENNPVYLEILLKEYLKTITTTPVIYTQVRNLRETGPEKESFSKVHFKYNEHITVHIDLIKSEQQLISEMHKKRYSNIKRAIKKGVRTVIGITDIDGVTDLMNKTYQRINLPSPPKELFLFLSDKLKHHVLFCAAFWENKMIACRVYLLYKTTIYDWYAGSDEEYFNLCPNDVLPWQCMIWAKQNHFTVYDFAGAGNPLKPYGVRDYKLKFGGRVVNTGRFQKVHKPMKLLIGKFGIRYYKYISKQKNENIS